MLGAIVRSSLQHRKWVLCAAVAITGYGVFQASRTRLDVFPEFAPPVVTIQTEAPGLSPEEVEQLVTVPVEQAVNGVGGLQSLRSQSIQGQSSVNAIFQDGEDVQSARQRVNERLATVATRLPVGVHAPIMAPLTSSISFMYAVGLTAPTLNPMDLRAAADWELKPRLLQIPGVANVSVYGGGIRQFQIQIIPGRVLALGITLDQVLQAARKSTGVRGSGFVDSSNQRILLKSEGQSLSPAAIAKVPVAEKDGAVLRLGDIAKVVEGPAPATSAAQINGEPGISLEIFEQPGADTIQVTRDIERALEELRPAFQGRRIAIIPRMFRPAGFIETSIGNVRHALLIGGLLVILVLVVFLRNWKTAFISLTAIPLSLLMATVLLEKAGASFNTMTLGGLAIALGEVVDDAVIDVENILRRLRQNREAGDPKSAFDVVLDASMEVRGAVVHATLVVALVMLPVLALSGIQGKLFAPLGWAYLLAVLASLLVALTVTPALTLMLLGKGKLPEEEPASIRAFKVRYGHLLKALMAGPKRLMVAAIGLVVLTLCTLPFLQGSFLPSFQEGHLLVQMVMQPGTSLDESQRLGKRVTAAMKQLPFVQLVVERTGRTEGGDDPWGPQFSEFGVELSPGAGPESSAELRRVVGAIPGANFAVKTYLGDRIDEVISGSGAQVVVKLTGPNLDHLEQAAADVKGTLERIKGAADVAVDTPPGVPQWTLRLKSESAARFGMAPVDVLDAVQVAFQGLPVAQIFQGNQSIDVAVTLDPSSRKRPEQIAALMVQTPTGRSIPLSALMEVVPGTGRYAVQHEGGIRTTLVTCNVTGRDLRSFVAEADKAVRNRLKSLPDVTPHFAGVLDAQNQAQWELGLHTILAIMGVLLVLSTAFKNHRNLILVMANLPFAMVGGLLAVFFHGGWVNLGSLVGFVTLFGITTRNSIMLVSHCEHLVLVEGLPWNAETARQAATERLVPILMTALVTGLALLPLAWGADAPGREIEGPMAIVILGGLLSSTLLNLLLLPTLVQRYGQFGAGHSPSSNASFQPKEA